MEGQESTAVTETSGVESASAAEVQETVQTEETSGVESVSAAETQPNNFEKAFAKRLSQEREKWDQEVNQKYSGYDEVNQNSQTLKELEEMLRDFGYNDMSEYKTYLAEERQKRLIAAEAEKFGVPEDFIRSELQPLKSEVEVLRKEREAFQKEKELIRKTEENNKRWNELFEAYPDVRDSLKDWKEGQPLPDWHNDQFESYLNRNYAPVDAYRLANQDRILRQKEQEILARVTERGEKSLLPSHDKPSGTAFSMENASFEDIKSISERVRRGERIVL